MTTPEQKKAIEHNKKHGLLCACNKQMIPYYDEQGREHGSKLVDGILHEYEDCGPVNPFTHTCHRS